MARVGMNCVKVRAAAISLFFLAAIAHGENLQKPFATDDEVYSITQSILLEQGLAPPVSSKPWTANELANILSQVNPHTLSDAGKRSYEHLQSRMSNPRVYDSGTGAIFSTGIQAIFETYLHTDEDNFSWEYGYEERAPFLTIPFELWLFDIFYADLEFTAKEAHKTVGNPDIPPNWSNIPDTLYYLDSYFPFRAFISIGGDHWWLQFGRDSVDWGNGNTGNLLISDYSDFYDLIQASTYWQNFKISAAYLIFEAWGDDAQTYKAWYGHRL